MIQHPSIRSCQKIGAASLLFIMIAGCAGRLPWYGNEKNGFLMEYRFPEDKSLGYEGTFIQTMSMERSGQTQEIGSNASGQFTMNRLGFNETGDQIIQVTVSGLEAVLESPRGDQPVNTDAIIGKSFQTFLSSRGIPKGFENNDSLDVGLHMNGPGRTNARHFFNYYLGDFFPVVPDEAKTVGETWTYQSKNEDDLGNIHVFTTLNSKYTLMGFENIHGKSCLKVKAEATGLLEGSANQGALTLEGDLEYNAVYYWDFRQGCLIQYDYELFGEATMAMINMGTSSYVIENKMMISLMK